MNKISGKRLVFAMAGVWGFVFFAAGQNYRLPVIPIEEVGFENLSNGLTLGLCPHPAVPNIFVRVELTGLPDDNRSRMLANLGLRWIVGGRSAVVEEKLHALRANLQFDGTGFSLDGPVGKATEILGLAGDLLLEPAMDTSYFLQVAGEWLQKAKLELEDANGIANTVVDHWIFRDTFSEMRWLNDAGRYGELREQCINFLIQNLRPEKVLVQVVVQVPDSDLLSSFKERLEKWQTTTTDSAPVVLNHLTQGKGPQVALVHQPGNRAFLKLLLPLEIKPGTREAVTLDLLQTMFAGFPGSPLNRQLAKEFRLPLGVLSGLTSQHGQTLLLCNGTLPNRDVPLIASLVMEKLLELSSQPLSEEKMQQGINWLSRLYRRKLEQPIELAKMAAASVSGAYDFSYHVQYLETLNSITATELHQLAARLIKPEKVYFIVAGDVKPLDGALTQLDADGKTSWFNSMGETIAASFFDVPKDLSTEEVLDKLATMHGWQNPGNKPDNRHLIYTGALDGTPVSLEAVRAGKDQLRINISLDEMEVNSIYGGNGAYFVGVMGQQQNLDDLTRKMLLLQPPLFPEAMDRWNTFEANIAGMAEIESAQTLVMEIKTPENFECTAWIDVQSGLLKGIKKPVDGRIIEVKYFDYKQMSGLWLPQRVVIEGYGPYPIIFRLEKADWNVPLDDRIFQSANKD